MPIAKVAVQLACLKLPFRKALVEAAKLGADAVEIDARGELTPAELSKTGLRQVKKLLEDYNLKVAAVGFRTRRGYDAPGEIERRVAATKEALTMARSLGAELVVNQVGRVPSTPEGPVWQQLVEVLTDLGAHSHRAGAWLACETGSEEGADLARLIAALPAGSVAVAFNPGNLIVNGFSPKLSLLALGGHVRYVMATDGVRDLARGRGLEVPLGRGSTDFEGLVGQLEEYAYRGYYTVARESSDNLLGELSQAVQFLRNL
jgi:sugar phosphate isomerase/epimerase